MLASISLKKVKIDSRILKKRARNFSGLVLMIEDYMIQKGEKEVTVYRNIGINELTNQIYLLLVEKCKFKIGTNLRPF